MVRPFRSLQRFERFLMLVLPLEPLAETIQCRCRGHARKCFRSEMTTGFKRQGRYRYPEVML